MYVTAILSPYVYTDYEGGFYGLVKLLATFATPPPYITVFAMAFLH